MLTEFVDQLSAEAGAPQPRSATAFPTLDNFNEDSTIALQWKDLAQDRVYQIKTAWNINTQHRTSFVLSLQTADGFCYTAWACGIRTKELLQNPNMLDDKDRQLFNKLE